LPANRYCKYSATLSVFTNDITRYLDEIFASLSGGVVKEEKVSVELFDA